ncbi:hypothetical protein N0V83_006792 [Neocucurbitaria cava]|uniref:Uncharacterized protein n=1 Tax=Neocucurbitaria cava TaxID=798079 RepID=A0A9W8Y6P5_9PLEO|nr:hypothetical protein N0V83_006792 [Neocucurbitaria cava]
MELPRHSNYTQMDEPPVRRPIKELRTLALNDFQYNGPLEEPAQAPQTEAQKAAQHLRSARDRFALKIPITGNTLCYTVDRAAVLTLYTQALTLITSSNPTQLSSEVTLKVTTILGLRSAHPLDVVFTSAGMLLPPLEPQYAEPRIEYADDEYGYRAAWRLKAWRKEGWPGCIPGWRSERRRR